MSLILDALRKSERARQQSLTGQIGSSITDPGRARLPTPWVTVIGLILLLNAIVLASLLWRNNEAAPRHESRTGTLPAAAAPVSKPLIRPLAEEAEADEPVTAAVQKPVLHRSTSTVPVVAAPATPVPSSASANSAPPLDTLPTAFQQALPALHLDVHGYAANPADRFVVINMQRYVAGDTLKEGPRVVAITAQGVILEYDGTRFLLPRN
ncbi:MAG TPA: general secretion pathway protein GspB [Gammaproteobacteria bacterium]|nr:general secretion pathway protein GspB [Gammaproteobacteria bacterium]